jgi:hypothetical protein
MEFVFFYKNAIIFSIIVVDICNYRRRIMHFYESPYLNFTSNISGGGYSNSVHLYFSMQKITSVFFVVIY